MREVHTHNELLGRGWEAAAPKLNIEIRSLKRVSAMTTYLASSEISSAHVLKAKVEPNYECQTQEAVTLELQEKLLDSSCAQSTIALRLGICCYFDYTITISLWAQGKQADQIPLACPETVPEKGCL